METALNNENDEIRETDQQSLYRPTGTGIIDEEYLF